MLIAVVFLLPDDVALYLQQIVEEYMVTLMGMNIWMTSLWKMKTTEVKRVNRKLLPHQYQRQ